MEVTNHREQVTKKGRGVGIEQYCLRSIYKNFIDRCKSHQGDRFPLGVFSTPVAI